MSQNFKEIDSKFESRQRKLFSEKTLLEIKEESMDKELTLGRSIKEKLCLQKRMQQKIQKDSNNANSNSSKIENILTISPELYKKCKIAEVTLDKLKDIISFFISDELDKKYIGLVGIRKLLCTKKPPIKIILNCDVLSGIISLLSDKYPVEFRYEALWCLINISYGDDGESEKIKNEGGIEKIIYCLSHDLDEIKELALWCIDNMAHEHKIRKCVAKKKLLNKLITLLSTSNNEIIIAHCLSVIKYLIKLYSVHKLEKIDINKLINLISKIIINYEYDPNNNDVKHMFYNGCYFLSYISEYYKKCKDLFFQNNVIQRVIDLLRMPNVENDAYFLVILIKIIGNMICGNANQTSQMMDYQILDILKKHLLSEKGLIKKEICWIISNIAADTEQNKIKLIENGFYPLLLQIYEKCEKSIRIEALFAIANFTLINDKYYLEQLINYGLLNVFSSGMKSDIEKEIIISLEALFNLLVFGKKFSKDGKNVIVNEMEKLGMNEVLEKLQYNRNEMIYEKSLYIIENFLDYECLKFV